MKLAIFAAAAAGITALWLALYRLPFASPRTRQRVRLRVSSITGIPQRLVFTILGTLIYVGLGAAAIWGLARIGGIELVDLLSWQVSGPGAALTLLTGIGAGSLTAFTMSLLQRRGDVPTAVSDVRWIQEILAVPNPWRSMIPGFSAALEEFYFRGVMLFGLLAAGAPAWLALVFTGVIFTAGQVVLTESRMQATVLAVSSVVLSVVCGMLTYVEASVVPAILVHASFAGYYTNMSTQMRRTA